jgi:hydroxymethylpyrimidine/phosphomethylpyrimidine kinase
MKKTLLTIAGLDPSGGAGALLDVRVFHDLGFHGAAALTALTLQTTRGVAAVRPVPAAFLAAQIEALEADLRIEGIKVGMAATEANLRCIGRFTAAHPEIPAVVDPVFRSTSGHALLDRRGLAAFASALRGRLTVLTPNLEEAGRLTGKTIATIPAMIEAARSIAADMRCACLIKGGHLRGEAVNVLHDGKRSALFGRPRLRGDVHGTGCILSAALTAYLAGGQALESAVDLATGFTHQAIARAIRVGRGRSVKS